jgi:hypothetical protein
VPLPEVERVALRALELLEQEAQGRQAALLL